MKPFEETSRWDRETDLLVFASSRMTLIQQTPIKGDGTSVDISLGSSYAKQLGLGEISLYDGTSTLDASKQSTDNADEAKQEDGKNAGGKKKKKNNKKKKK